MRGIIHVMISINVPNNLGRKAFNFMLYGRISFAIVCILVAIVFAIMGNSLVNGIVDIISATWPVSHSVQVTVSSVVSNGIFALIAIGIIIFMVAFVKSSLQYRNFSFTLEELNLKIKRGIFSTNEMSTPYRQIRGVEIERGINYKMFGISRLVLNTVKEGEGSGDHVTDRIVLEPIDALLAEEVREILERKIGVQIIERAGGPESEGGVISSTHL